MSNYLKITVIVVLIVALGPSIIGASFAAFVNMDAMWFNPSNWHPVVRAASCAWFFIVVASGAIIAITA